MRWPDNNTWQFGEEPDLVINAPMATIPAMGPDMYPTPSVPSGMTEDRYIKWIQVLPGAVKTDHHILVFAHQPATAAGALIGRDRGNGGPSDRAIGTEKVTRLAEYARGNDGDIYDQNEGMLLQAGAVISFEFHYHPNGESPEVDNTKVGIKFFPKGFTPQHLVSTLAINSNESLVIAPGDPAARNDSYFRLEQAARLVSFQPHGHYRLAHMTLEAILPNGQVQVLTDVPRFVWTWQITYPYKYQPAFPKGTVLHSISYHDNSAGNKENPDPTAFVGHGARTVDEMDNGWLDFYYITDEEYAQLEREHSKAVKVNTGAQ